MLYQGSLAVVLIGFQLAAASPVIERGYGQSPPAPKFASQTTCGGNTFTYDALAGYGIVVADDRDKFGDTISFGSSIAIDQRSWKYNKKTKIYTGVLYGLPDRGWNTGGTINYQNRVHKFSLSFNPVASSATPNLAIVYLDSVLLTDPTGKLMTGLDANTIIKYKGFPDLPASTYTGDGFGGPGEGDTRVVLDSEGLVLAKDGGFWISDEYGPYIYHFSALGQMTQAIRPPNAFIPLRNGTESFSSDTPSISTPGADPIPVNPTSGRANNQGLEGLTVSPDGKHLYALMQSALIQDGGSDKTTNRNARLLKYDITHPSPKLVGEFVVPLPTYIDPTKSAKNNPRTAAQSEIHALGNGQFLVLARDSGFGLGVASGTQSNYRHLDVFDINKASNINKAQFNAFGSSITTTPAVNTLVAGITPALYCPFLDFNNNTELAKFGLHNGGVEDLGLLNEKWESIAMVPVDGKEGKDGEWYVISASDNDFVTQNGFYGFGEYTYHDASGYNFNNQVLVFKVTIPRRLTGYSKQ